MPEVPAKMGYIMHLYNSSDINKRCGRSTAITFLFYLQKDHDPNEDRSLLFNFLLSLKLPSCVSPLHDKDVNEIDADTGVIEYKPSHYHVTIDAENQKAVSQWFDYLYPIRDYIAIAPFDKLDETNYFSKIDNVVKVWKNENNVKNMRSLLRYFKHLDNPEKFQYIDEEFTTFCGFELDKAFYSQTDTKHILKDIIKFVRNNDIYNYADLIDYCDENNPEWFNVLSSGNPTNFMLGYIKSNTFRNTGAQDVQIGKYEEKARKIKDM